MIYLFLEVKAFVAYSIGIFQYYNLLTCQFAAFQRELYSNSICENPSGAGANTIVLRHGVDTHTIIIDR